MRDMVQGNEVNAKKDEVDASALNEDKVSSLRRVQWAKRSAGYSAGRTATVLSCHLAAVSFFGGRRKGERHWQGTREGARIDKEPR